MEALRTKKCGRCHSTLLEEYFDSNRKGELKKCCRGCLKTHKCPTCDYCFGRNSDLQTHIKFVHLKQRNHKCPNCDQSFGINANLQTHIKTVHLKQRNHKCPECNQSFGRNNNLQIHIKSQHLKIKDFKCLECDYCSSENGHLQTHIKTVHLRQKDFKCPDCDLSFGQNAQLQTHIKSIHLRIKDFKCPDCDQSFGRNEQLQNHIKVCTGTRKCSSGEFEVMKALDSLGFKENTDYFYDEPYDNVRDKSQLRFDFRLETTDDPIFIEFDGQFHYHPIRKSNTTTPEEAETNLATTKKRDTIKNDYCNDNGFLLLRIPYWEKNNINQIVSDFIAEHTA